MKKYERINQYLDNVWRKDEQRVKKLTWQELRTVPEFADIGDRTLADILKEYKFKRGVLNKNHPKTLKRKIVWQYLEELQKKLPANKFENVAINQIAKILEPYGISRGTVYYTTAQFRKENCQQTNYQIREKKDSKIAPEIFKNISVNLKSVAKALDLKHIELGRLLGLSENKMHLLTSGKRIPNMELLYKLHDQFGVNINAFLFNTGPLFIDDDMNEKYEHRALVGFIENLNREMRGIKRRIVKKIGEE